MFSLNLYINLLGLILIAAIYTLLSPVYSEIINIVYSVFSLYII
jgi:hypothetical protein